MLGGVNHVEPSKPILADEPRRERACQSMAKTLSDNAQGERVEAAVVGSRAGPSQDPSQQLETGTGESMRGVVIRDFQLGG